MNHLTPSLEDALVEVRNAPASSSIVVICEHASAHIPSEFGNLGLADRHIESHVVWDPGAMVMASHLVAQRYYKQFWAAGSDIAANKNNLTMVTVHSFTPFFHGKPREVEIGVLHDRDARLADALLSNAKALDQCDVRRNEPCGPADGVTNALGKDAIPSGHLNVMLQVRNDIVAEESAQVAMARNLSDWLVRALAKLQSGACTI